MKGKTCLQPNGFLLLLPAGLTPSLFKAIAVLSVPASSSSAAVTGGRTHRGQGVGRAPLLW